MSDDEEEKQDLTRIEDLAEFLHDESDDSLFDEEPADESAQAPELPSLDDLETDEFASQTDEADAFDSTPEVETQEEIEEDSFETSESDQDEFSSGDEFGGEDSSFDTQEDNNEFSNDDDQFGSDFSSDDSSEEEQSEFNTDSEDQFGSEDQEEDQFSNEFDSDESAETVDQASESDEFKQADEEPEEIEVQEEPQGDDSFEPAQVSEYQEQQEETKAYTPPQNFDDLRQFAERISYGAVAQGGNPPFSLILRGIRYQEDAEDIQIILKEHGLVNDENQQSIEQGLANGSLLISQISEYSAIYLAHKFRRFDLDVIVGLSDEIHPSQSYDADARGLVSKQNIRQNIHESIDLERSPVNIQNIILSTTPTLEGYTIQEYLSVISHHNILSASEIEEFSAPNQSTGDEIVDAIQKDLTEVLEKHGTHDSELLMPFGRGLETLYKEMADALRTKALKIGANAIIGINYQLTPVFANQSGSTDVQYKVTCLGSAVWVVGN